jgi:hypothetical protein
MKRSDNGVAKRAKDDIKESHHWLPDPDVLET